MGELDGRVAIVTGSSSGIGEAIARRLSELGCRRRGQLVVFGGGGHGGGRVAAVGGPLRAGGHQRPGAGPGADRRARSSGSAGSTSWSTTRAGRRIVAHADLDALTDEILRRTFEVNVFGTWWLTKAAMPYLRRSPDPNVVMITSVAGLRPVGSSIAYAMSKAALNHLTAVAGQVLRAGAGQRRRARAGRHPVVGGLGRAARGGRRHRLRCIDRATRRTAPRP